MKLKLTLGAKQPALIGRVCPIKPHKMPPFSSTVDLVLEGDHNPFPSISCIGFLIIDSGLLRL